MRKASLWTAVPTAIALLCVVGVAAATGMSAVVGSGNLEMTFGERFVPKALSRTAPTPIVLRLWSQIKSTDDSPPPALSELVFDADRSSAIDVRGLPTCSSGHRDIREPGPIKGCTDTIVGAGMISFDIQFPEEAPIPTKAKLVIYNGGVKAGVTTLHARAFLVRPITTAVVMTIRIEEIRESRFASRTTVTVPKIANGAGSLTSFSVKLGRTFTRDGKRVSLLTAKCPTGRIYTRAGANFVDGRSIQSPLVRDCTPRPTSG
jgi:hypothetical protein